MTSTAHTTKQSRGACVHHWVIESPNGRKSAGSCKRCGRTRKFVNATENVMWEHTNTLRSSPVSALRNIPRAETSTLSDEIVSN